MDEESKNILIESINDANRILEKYNYELRYCQYDIHFEKPLKPTLFIKDRRKNVQYGLIIAECSHSALKTQTQGQRLILLNFYY